MSSPPMDPSVWVARPPASPLKSDLPFEQDLKFPPGTLAVLRGAFENRFTRSEGWEIPFGATVGDLKATFMAASLFKRGVGARQTDGGPSSTSKRLAPVGTRVSRGRYAIEFSTQPLSPKSLPADAFFLLDEGFLKANQAWEIIPKARRMVLKVSERRKSLETVAQVIGEVRRRRLSPKTPWFLVGGGILCDLGGFAASLYGASFTMVPTTLLAMVDASLGGKTGVNFPPFGKNQVGHFAFPRRVLVHPNLLRTLPRRQWQAGGAECLKHALLTGDLTLLESTAKALVCGEQEPLVELLPRLIGVKAEVVARDSTETGERAILNLGHTAAHAFEAISQGSVPSRSILLHGEAVAAGLIYALALSYRLGHLSEREFQVRTSLINESGCCPTQSILKRRLKASSLLQGRFLGRVYELILGDKKRLPGTPQDVSHWVLLNAKGAVEIKKRKSFLIPVQKADFLATWTLFIKAIEK